MELKGQGLSLTTPCRVLSCPQRILSAAKWLLHFKIPCKDRLAYEFHQRHMPLAPSPLPLVGKRTPGAHIVSSLDPLLHLNNMYM